MPYVLTATDLDLWNRGSSDVTSAPALALHSFHQTVSMTGTASERAFHAAPFAIQLALTPLLPGLLRVPRDVAERNIPRLVNLCEGISAALAEVVKCLEAVHTLVDVDEFYDVYRPLLGGWSHGLRLPALTDDEADNDAVVGPKRAPSSSASAQQSLVVTQDGPSAGQTAIILLLDLALGVEHGEKLKAFQSEQKRTYLPAAHRAVVEALAHAVAAHGNLRDAAQAAGAPADLVDAHAAAAKGLLSMRSFHYGLATRFLRRSLKGTGGSDFRAMLGEGVKATRALAANDGREEREGTARTCM